MPDEEYRPFRPRSSRRVALSLAVLVPVVIVTGSYFVPGVQLLDRLGFIAFSLLVSLILWRYANVAALPGPDGLVVRNIIGTTRLEWAQIVSVRFGDRPWPQLDLADGQTLAVLGIQRSDGPVAVEEARRLARLIADHEPGSDH